MNRRVISAALCCLGLATACEKDEPSQNIVQKPVAASELYVLNEGVFGQTRSTLTYYNAADSTLAQDYFMLRNGRGLGEGGNDMQRYGGKIYCVLTESSVVEVFDARSGKSLRQVELKDSDGRPRKPRSIAFWEGKAYVCSFDNTVARIDTQSCAVEASVTVGRNPDGICAAAGKLYVSNSGGMDFANLDTTVSVVDIATFTETKKIAVGINPFTVLPDKYGDVYVITRGNYGDVPYRLHRIGTATDELLQTFDIAALNFTIAGSRAYLYDYNYATMAAAVKVLDVETEQLVTEQLVADGIVGAPNGIAVDAVSGNIYIADAKDYSSTGELLCLRPDGTLLWKMSTGITPRSVVLMQ